MRPRDRAALYGISHQADNDAWANIVDQNGWCASSTPITRVLKRGRLPSDLQNQKEGLFFGFEASVEVRSALEVLA